MNEIQSPQPKNEKANGLALVFVSIALLLFAVMIVVYVYSQDRLIVSPGKPTPTKQINSMPNLSGEGTPVNSERPRIIVPFLYTVQSISNNEIVLSSEEGLIRLSPSITSVYYLDKTNPVELQNVTVGAKVKLEMNPGDYNWVYIQD